jgi:hypothetical protein
MLEEMAKALGLLSRARRMREYAAAARDVIETWPELMVAWRAMERELADIRQRQANAEAADNTARLRVPMLESALELAVHERDEATRALFELRAEHEELAAEKFALDAWVIRAKVVTEAAKALRTSPMSDKARRALVEATLNLECS